MISFAVPVRSFSPVYTVRYAVDADRVSLDWAGGLAL